jgi:hypothetical protein
VHSGLAATGFSPYLKSMNNLNMQTKSLEDAYFMKEDQIMIDNLRKLQKLSETKENLKAVSGITDPEVLDTLVKLDIHPQTLSSLAVIPLVAVAWADGSVDAKERDAVLSALKTANFAPGIDLELVGHWLEVKPKANLLEAWLTYSRALAAELTPEQRHHLRDDLLDHARQVAQASGGLLGVGAISAAEKAVLDKLTAAWA